MKSYGAWIVLCVLVGLLIGVVGCRDGSDEDEANADDDAADDDGSPGNDDDDNDDDDGPVEIVGLTVEDAPEGNPLARRITVQTNRPCSLAGFVTTAGEPGRGPSQPAATPTGTEHSLWFYGLLADASFDYVIHLAGEPETVLAGDSFTTPALPEDAPLPDEIENTAQADPSIWAGFIVNDAEVAVEPWLTVIGRVMIVDRDGRPRYYHEFSKSQGEFMEGPQRLPDGGIAWSTRANIEAVRLNGSHYTLFDVDLDAPHLVSSHHNPYIWEDLGKLHAIVIFNRLGPGLECDYVTPTNKLVGDGVAWLAPDGREISRWTVFDHQDELPPDLLSPCNCDGGFWGPGTYDYSHANAVYPTDGGHSLLISFRNLSRVIKVDVATGEVLWQLGKDLDFEWISGEPEFEQWFYAQHDARELPNGHILMYDNGPGRVSECGGTPWSRALELEIDEEAMTVGLVWEHRIHYAAANGMVRRLPNENTMIFGGWNSLIVEATPEGEEVWRLHYASVFLLPNIYGGLPYPALWEYPQ